MSKRSISIIVPVYNSRATLPLLLAEIDQLRQAEDWDLELILIDDGSADGSFEEITRLFANYPFIRGLRLSRNFGHQAAVMTGLELSRGEYIAIIDDDLQDPPSLLPGFFRHLDNGYDVAYGVRQKRKESWVKVAAYKFFYQLIRALSDIDLPLDSGDFCVMKRNILASMLRLKERNPYIRGIRAWVGFRQIGVVYERQQRAVGESGYTLKKLLGIASDGIFSFSDIPLRIITYAGIAGLVASSVYAVYILGIYITVGISVRGFPTLILFVIFFGSLNIMSLGIVGEYIARIYAESKNRPHAIINAEVGRHP